MIAKLNSDVIKELTSDSTAYQDGRLYYLQKRVFDLQLDNKCRIIYAIVKEDNDYGVEIKFDNKWMVSGFKCECSAFPSRTDACSHVVAALFASLKKLEPIYKTMLKKKIEMESHNQFFSYYEYMNSDSDTGLKEVQLEIFLNMERYYNKLLPSIEFKIGMDKMYMIRSVIEFVEKYVLGAALEFGKSFTFDPNKHTFSSSNRQVMDLLGELYEYEKLQQTLSTFNMGNSFSSFKAKKVYLPQSIFKRFLKIIEGQTFTLRMVNEEITDAVILNKDLPIELTLKKQEHKLKLDVNLEHQPIPLTEDKKYFLYTNKIYKVSDKQMKYFEPIWDSYNNAKSDLVFLEEESSRFVSSVLPFLKKVGEIKIDPEIESNIVHTDLVTKIFLNKTGKGISANVEFNYDDLKINPFVNNDATADDSRIILRDIESERNILGYFEKENFKVRNDLMHLEDEGEIYDFIRYTLPQMQDICEVYYSNDFKKINIKDSKAFHCGIRLNTRTSMLEFSFYHDDITIDELNNILSALRLKKRYYRLKDGSFISLDDNQLDAVADLIDSIDISGNELNKKFIELPKYRAVYMDNQLKQLNLSHVERNQSFKQLVQNITEPQDMEFELPDNLKPIMREYQKTGFKWLKTLAAYNLGGILADDMGLGKTLQTIAFILSNKNQESTPCIVVAPSSLVYGWQEEIGKFAPELRVLIVSGDQKQRLEQIQDINNADIIVTSYPLIRRDIELYDDIEFSYCFIDEAQHIKNPDSMNAKSVKQIRAKGYFALTGTPIENSLTELWSIFDFIMPGYLLSHGKFVDKYERPITKSSDRKAFERLSSLINPFILRRLKKDVLKELPDKIETRMVAELTEGQKKIYLAYLHQARNDIARELADNGFERSHIKILAILTRLRQVCCHPALFIEDYNEDSGKMQLLEEILEDALVGGHRILLFSQFTSMLKLIRRWLDTKSIRHLYLDGSTPIQQRGEMVKAFNGGEGEVFLISLKAGGTGLNLTGADMVIHFDPWWNPAVEDQATDRAYRIGQKNKVQVIKLITQGTIEEKVFELQQKKKDMIESLIKPGETFITKLTESEIKSLFDM